MPPAVGQFEGLATLGPGFRMRLRQERMLSWIETVMDEPWYGSIVGDEFLGMSGLYQLGMRMTHLCLPSAVAG